MSVDTFGHSPSWTHEEMVAAGYVTDDEAQTLTPRGQLRIDLDELRAIAGAELLRLIENAGRALDNLNGPYGDHPGADLDRSQIADALRWHARRAIDGAHEDVLSCVADVIDPETLGVGDDPAPHPAIARLRIAAENARIEAADADSRGDYVSAEHARGRADGLTWAADVVGLP